MGERKQVYTQGSTRCRLNPGDLGDVHLTLAMPQ